MRFEDLEAWQLSRAVTRKVYQITRVGAVSRDFRLCSQIQAASVSIMSNIAEGFERTGLQEKSHFYNIARGSCGEVRSQLYVLEDVYGVSSSELDLIRSDVLSLGRIISGLIKSTQSRKPQR